MIGFFVVGVSIGTITAISVDRVLALHYHMRYAIIVTNTRVKFTVGAIWSVMFLSLGFYLWDKYVFHLMAGVFSAVYIIICTASYAKIYRIVRVHQQQINIQHNAVENKNAGSKMHLSRVKKTAMSTFVFYICMLFCYFPGFVLLTLFGTLHVPWKPEWTFSSTLTFMNSAINPFLYCWRLRELREAIVKTTKQLFHRPNENWSRRRIKHIKELNQQVRQNSNRFRLKNDNFARTSCLFVHFFAVVARLRRQRA